MTAQCGRDLVQQIQMSTHSAFCTSGALPITANNTAKTLAFHTKNCTCTPLGGAIMDAIAFLQHIRKPYIHMFPE